jgi:hypothetical protein
MAQKNSRAIPVSIPESTTKPPYQIYTNGRQITIRSTTNLKQLMVWSASGHRVVEQKDIDKDSYAFRLDVNEKIFFLRIQLVNGKVYTQKIGI